MAPELSTAASIIGMVLGTAGFVLGLLSYLRDRPRIKVSLNMNMVDSRSGRQAAMFVVTNTGRRAIFISAVAMDAPALAENTYMLLTESIAGTKLAEGDKPYKHLIQLEHLLPYREQWRKIRMFAEDSTGRRYYSAYPSRKSKRLNGQQHVRRLHEAVALVSHHSSVALCHRLST